MEDGNKKFKFALDYKTFDQCSHESPKTWLVENVIALREDSSWFGPPGAGKSGLLLDLAVHVASGRDWRGHKFNRSKHTNPEEANFYENRGVVYFALERADLTRRRLRAYMERDELSDLPIAVVSQSIHLCDPACVPVIQHTLHQFFEDTGAMPGLVIIDTWGKAIAPYSRNDAATHDLAALHLKQVRDGIKNGIKRFHLATIGHSGKNIEAGESGSNAREAHIDLEVQVSGGAAKITKGNDQDKGEMTRFDFETVTIQSEDDPPWSVAILTADTPATEARREDFRPTGRKGEALTTLEALIARSGQNGFVPLDHWKEELRRVGWIKPGDKNDRVTFKRVQEGLSQHLIFQGDLVAIKPNGKIPTPPVPYSVAA